MTFATGGPSSAYVPGYQVTSSELAAANAKMLGYIQTLQSIAPSKRTPAQQLALTTDLSTYARQSSALAQFQSSVANAPAAPPVLPSGGLLPGSGLLTGGLPVVPISVGLGGAVPIGGGSVPGGSAEPVSIGSGILSGLSRTTAGLNWSSLAIVIALLAGGWIVLTRLIDRPRTVTRTERSTRR